MPMENGLTLDEAMRVAVQQGRAEIELVVPAMLRLYDEVRDAQRRLAAYEDKPCACSGAK